MHYFQLLKRIMDKGKIVTCRGIKTKELINVTLDLNGYNYFYHPIHRTKHTVDHYMYGELAWYLSGERSIEKILPYSKFWEQIRNSDNTANSNYGDLVFYRKNSHGITSYDWAKQQIMYDKETRKAIVLYNDRELFYNENKDLICNQYQHFIIRENRLNCIVSLRSSDAIMGLSFNAPWWSLVHQQLWHEIKLKYPEVKLGWIKANLNSSHIYENKWELVNNMLSDDKAAYYYYKLHDSLPIGQGYMYYDTFIRSAFSHYKWYPARLK